jgi:ABC-2 type transport system permease protein
MAVTGTEVPVLERRTTTARRQSFGSVLVSEWVKLRSLRSTWITLGAVLAVLVGLGAVAAAVSTGSVESPQGGGPMPVTDDPLQTVMTGANFGVLLLGVFGCLAGAREYGSRMIASTVAAVPRRWRVVAAKAVVSTALVLPVALIGVFAAFFAGMAVLGDAGAPTVALSDDGVLRSVIGMAGYLTSVSLIGLGLGILLRSVAASIATLVGVVLILPPIAAAVLPDSWNAVLQYLPTNAAAAFTAVTATGDSTLGVGAGMAVLAAWAVAAVGAAVVSIVRRDV